MATHSQSGDIAHVVETLAEQVRRIETAGRAVAETAVSSGDRGLDRLLGGGGFQRGTLVEWLAVDAGSGAATLAMQAAAGAAENGGAVVVIDRQGRFYPPAAVNLGIDLARLFVVRTTNDADHAWAFDQVLRTRGVAAVWGEPGQPNEHTLRRWQLAAEASGALGMLLRDEAVRHEPSWAHTRLVVEPIAAVSIDTVSINTASIDTVSINTAPPQRNRRLRVELVRLRCGRAGRMIELEISGRDTEFFKTELFDPGQSQQQIQEAHPSTPHLSRRDNPDETRTVHLASQLAAAKTRRRARGA